MVAVVCLSALDLFACSCCPWCVARCLDLHPEAPVALEALLRFAPASAFSAIRNTAASVFLGLGW